jgi:hypothetical protein
MIESILAGIISTIILGIVSWVWYSYVVLRPLLKIHVTLGPCVSNTSGSDGISITWNYNISLYNETKHDALDLAIDFIKRPGFISIVEPAFKHIKGLETTTCGLQCKKVFPRDLVKASANRLEEFLPDELKQFRLAISFKNEKGTRFWVLAAVSGKNITTKYLLRKPSIWAT